MNHTLSIRCNPAGLRLLVSVLMGISLSLFGIPLGVARAASIIVTTTVDEINTDGDCSLREAIEAANEDHAVDACSAGNGADSIRVPAGLYTGRLVIHSDLSMIGVGAATTIVDNDYGGTVVTILSGTVMLSGMTFQKGSIITGAGAGIVNHGKLTLTQSVVAKNQAVDAFDIDAGGIYNLGTMIVQDSAIVQNSATLGGGILNTGDLSLMNSTVSNNNAPYHRHGATRGQGAGIANFGTLNVVDSTFNDNNAGVAGGGIFNTGTAVVTRSRFGRGQVNAGGGGGISNWGVMTVTHSLIHDNVAAFYTSIDGYPIEARGGGIDNGDTLTLLSSTISGNKANRDGGGINNTGNITINNSTITNNAADQVYNQFEVDQIGDGGGMSNVGRVTVMNSLIAENSDRGGEAPDCNGVLTSQGYNLIQNTTGCTITGDTRGNLLGVDPQLGPLQDQRGSTPAHALLPNSPAIDAGNPAAPGGSETACLSTDQHGAARPQDGNGDGIAWCDIGALEVEDLPQGLTGAYYDSRDFTTLKRTRLDTTVNFDWGYGSPDGAIESSTFSARWTGQVVPRFSERTTFFTQNDDGVRLWVNGQLLIDDWHDHGLSEHQGTISVQAGVPVSIQLDYYENHGQTAVKLLWASPSQPKEIIPADQLRPAPGLIGAYYQNADFTNLVLSRQDAPIAFDWGYGSPDPSIEISTFAVRWMGQVIPSFSGQYTFVTQNDDGVRLWVNGQLLIDDWRDHGLSEHQGAIDLQAGVPVSIRLDYYENHGQSAVTLLWASPSQPKQIIPASQLLPPQ